MLTASPRISLTTFNKFILADSNGKLTRVRDFKRQYDDDYSPGPDFWKQFREAVPNLHERAGRPADLRTLVAAVAREKREQYQSAADGYCKFWGRKRIELLARAMPFDWTHDRLTVRIGPDFVARINGTSTLVKLHTDRKLTVSQRQANTLLYLLGRPFASTHVPIIVDVHRGRAFSQTAPTVDHETILRMQASAFLTGWDAIAAAGGQRLAT